MKFLKVVLAICVLNFAMDAYAGAVTRQNLSIVKIHPMSVDRLHCPNCSGITRIYVNSGSWGNTNCRTDAGDLYKEDDHILSILLTAWVTNKPLMIEVNDQDKPIDEVCKITAVYVDT